MSKQNRITRGVNLLLLLILALLLILSQGVSPAALEAGRPTELLINGAMVDSDNDHLPDGWSGIDLHPSDQVQCGPKRCKFAFIGGQGQRTLYQKIVPTVVLPYGTRITATVGLTMSNIGPGSYIELFGLRNERLTTIHIYNLPTSPTKQKRDVTFSVIAGGDGIDHLYLIYTITAASKAMFSGASVTTG